MSADPPKLPDDPSLEDWLAYKSRLKYLETLNFAAIDDVATWVRQYYRDAAEGARRRAELVAGSEGAGTPSP